MAADPAGTCTLARHRTLCAFPCRERFGFRKVHGIRLKRGATRPPGVPAPGSIAASLRRFDAGFTAWPADLLRNARSWSLDDAQLTEAVRLPASQISIVGAAPAATSDSGTSRTADGIRCYRCPAGGGDGLALGPCSPLALGGDVDQVRSCRDSGAIREPARGT